MNSNRRDFLGGLAASLALGGCRSPWWYGERPALRFGVISDIHVTTPESTAEFRRALAYFRDRDVDAVLLAGDLSDWGLKSGLKYVADAWYDVFPDDRAPDGRKVEKLFVTGNHDYDGWWYGDMTLDMHVQGYCEDEATTRLGVQKCWEEAFREPFAEIRKRTVKGYTFVSSEWHVDGKEDGDESVAKWLAAHADELKGDMPFFYFRHSPIPATVACSPDKPSALTDALRKFPNAVSFNGHTHWTLNDERSIWQDEFTAISVPSMSYTTIPKGYDNGSDVRTAKSLCGMKKLPSRIDLEEAQGYVVSVYADRMELERHDFEHLCEAASPWIVPLGAGRAKPYSFAAHAKATPVPQFPASAAVKNYVTNMETRNDRWTIFMTLEFPAAKAADGGRVYDYEVRAEMEADGRVAATKRYLSPAFYKLPEAEPETIKFHFDAMDLPERGAYRLKVYPRNCFGAAGRPIASRILESKPGKAKPWYKWN